ncbi:hypothetical protein [Caulobacter segnis]
MLGHHDFRVYVTSDAFIDVGAGSLTAVPQVDEMRGSGLLGTIGRFCEVNETARIFAAGEHDNDQPVNITFGGFTPLTKHADKAMKPSNPFRIGSGVVISAGAMVLAGAEIGDGAVIGAGAVVTKPVQPFGIYAGVPAKKLRSRQTFAPWWDFSIPYMLENQQGLNEIASDPSAYHDYRVARPRFVLNMANGALNLSGFLDGETIQSFGQAPKSVSDYVAQAVLSENPYWLADCWA